MRASIIIPTNDRLDLLIRCVESVRRYSPEDIEIIVVDNGSADGTISWCLRERIRFVSLARNEGYPAACNKGLRVAAGDALVLLNNDTVVSSRWLDNLLAALYSAPDIGMVGPVTNYASGRQQVRYPYADLEEFQRIAAEVNVSDPAKWIRTERIVGVCLAFRRELMERIGLLDERFSPGHYEDDDYCLRARLHGFGLLICPDALIHHEGSASFARDGAEAQQRLVERNYRLFLDKWQVDPRAFI
ncbi:glycosyltransferase family 2 protein [Cohnella xylanilytica]|uniref:Glycosyltransferase family 2 protein n=1 Tax=Cohnella xylanilytica TaxID=557555 RepID=A0A841U851_9BACL|nr:glycosyltransferase family 2 protein [Cohnella xylanilytica]MBB6694140.1 glycosyltransferase family 2 protein [Cohnella xylanilytica]